MKKYLKSYFYWIFMRFQVFEGLPKQTDYLHVDVNRFTFSDSKMIGARGVDEGLVLALYAPKTKKTGLLHLSRKCSQDSLNMILNRFIEGMDCPYKTLEAALAGEKDGNQILSALVKNILGLNQIPILGQDLGENRARAVYACPDGNVEVYRLKFPEIEIVSIHL